MNAVCFESCIKFSTVNHLLKILKSGEISVEKGTKIKIHIILEIKVEARLAKDFLSNYYFHSKRPLGRHEFKDSFTVCFTSPKTGNSKMKNSNPLLALSVQINFPGRIRWTICHNSPRKAICSQGSFINNVDTIGTFFDTYPHGHSSP